jgi:hypothetical protein
MTKSIDGLLKNAKPFWEKMSSIPHQWLESYNMSEELTKMQHDAVKRTHEFGYGSKMDSYNNIQENKTKVAI